MTNLRELKNIFNQVYGMKPPKGKSKEWLVREYDKAQDLLENVRKLGYDGVFEMQPIRDFLRMKAI